MVDSSMHSSSQLHIGVILFDETHSRVFAVRGLTIEDAREFTENAGAAMSKHTRTGKVVFAPEWMQYRVQHTAQMVTSLHESRHFDALLVCASRRSRDLLCRGLPVDLRSCPIASIELAVTAGESAILAAMLAAAPGLARRWAKQALAQRPAAMPASPGLRSNPFAPSLPLSGMRMPYASFTVGATPARATHPGMAPV
jgi:hypothetical protein